MSKEHSLKRRLVVSIGLLAVVSALLLSQLASQLSRNQIVKEESALLQNFAVRMTTQLAHDMSARANEIVFLANQDLIRERKYPLEKKKAIFERMRNSYPHYAWIGMTDKDGNIVAGTDGLLVGKNVAQRGWFMNGKEGLAFGDAHDAFLLAKLLPKPKWDDLPLRLVDVSAPVLDEHGKFLGVICGHLSFDWAFEARESMLDQLLREKIDLVVLNREGKVLMGTPQLPSLKVDLSSLQAYKGLSSSAWSVVNEPWADGQNYLTAAVRETSFRNYPGMGWVVIARKDEQSAFAPADRLSNWILLGAVSTAIAFSFLLWLMLSRSLQPLEEITDAARKIQENDLAAEIPVPTGNDEVSIFARTLAGLVNRLRGRNADLRLAGRVFEETGQGILIADKDNRILKVNRAFTHITGYTQAEVEGQSPTLLKSGRQSKEFYQNMWNAIQRNGSWQGEIWNRTKSGHTYPEWLTINTLTDETGNISHYIGIFDDISEKKEYERRLVHLANYDTLTDLPNRNLLQQLAQQVLESASLNNVGIALLFVDLDKFKNINDSLGHVAGDMVLKEVAARFKAQVKDADILARWGGDEFVVVSRGADSIEASAIAKRLVECVRRPFNIEGGTYHIGMSIGIAMYPINGRSVDNLLRCADTAMYKAKDAGTNHYRFYESVMNSSVERFLKIDSSLRHALDQGGLGLSLALQPQFRTDGKKIVGVEVLIRWEHPDLGQVSPAQFIPIAEETGQIIRLGDWVIFEATRISRELSDAGFGVIPISINCSAQQLHDDSIIASLQASSEKYGVPPANLMIEVTESAIMRDEFKAMETLAKLRALGYRLSIDDFGTGYSCLNYIQKIHPSEIKVDQSFVRDMLTNPDSRSIISFTISLAESMEMEVVAEGVETEMQRAELEKMGKLKLQGFLLGKPMPLPQFIDLVRSDKSLLSK
jgi:diguanylate cyclase (GGDEF)-like protein/PAS domain S-box-containing protein